MARRSIFGKAAGAASDFGTFLSDMGRGIYEKKAKRPYDANPRVAPPRTQKESEHRDLVNEGLEAIKAKKGPPKYDPEHDRQMQ